MTCWVVVEARLVRASESLLKSRPFSEVGTPDDPPYVELRSPSDGLRLLGSRLGSERASQGHSYSNVANIAHAIALVLRQLEDLQVSLLLLRQCLRHRSAPLSSYWILKRPKSRANDGPEIFVESAILRLGQVHGRAG